MKKKIFAVLLIVAIVTALAVGFTACNKAGDEDARVSNVETLGTAAAMLASSGAVASAAGENDEGGINITFGTDEASLIASASCEGMSEFFDACLSMTAEGLHIFVDENNVKIENLKKDDAEFVAENDYTIKVSITLSDAENETVTHTMYLAIDTNGADIEGKSSFDFILKVIIPAEEEGADPQTIATINGTATYNNEIGGLVFSLSADFMGATIDIYATKTGKVAVGIDIDAGSEVAAVSTSLKIELGKISETQYGANVEATTSGTVLGTSLTAKINASVTADQSETSNNLAINGNVSVKIVPVEGASNYSVSAAITGTATYDAVNGYVITANGTAQVVTEAKTAA